MSPTKCVHETVRNCKTHLVAKYSGRYILPKRTDSLFTMGYDLDIIVEASLLLLHLSLPRRNIWKQQHK